jgi:hypothetical protein
MPNNRPYYTLIITILLAITGTLLAFFTDWMIAIPLFFGLGIPLLHLHKPLSKKIILTILIMAGNVLIFLFIVLLILNIPYESQLLQALVVGVAGAAILLLNGWLIKSIKIDVKTLIITFSLAALSLPVGIWITETFLNDSTSMMAEFLGQYGIMILWMTLTTMGIVFFGLNKPTIPANK